MFVKIFKLGEENEVVTVFPLGAHVIGRGPALQCNDKRVSRNHATIDVAENEVKITSNHINPCFLKAADSRTVTILAKDLSASLNDGDTFALLPDMFWFKIKIMSEEEVPDATPIQEEIKNGSKRHIYDAEVGTSEKRIKFEDDGTKQESSENNGQVNNNVKVEQEEGNHANQYQQIQEVQMEEPCNENQNQQSSNEPKNENQNQQVQEEAQIKEPNNENQNNQVQEEAQVDETKIKPTSDHDSDQQVKEEVQIEEPSIENQNNQGQEEAQVEETNIKPNTDHDSNDADSTSNTKVKGKREKCWYGAQCYRKNPVHRQDFTHPGDSDFESDPDDNRPSCSFGPACYRKNKDHRRNYKHPPQQPPNKLKNKRTRKKVDRLNYGNHDSDELSDASEDPFVVDGDSDEYIEDSNDDDDDTDWEDSQNVDEDTENMKRLVKEAKRFIKN